MQSIWPILNDEGRKILSDRIDRLFTVVDQSIADDIVTYMGYVRLYEPSMKVYNRVLKSVRLNSDRGDSHQLNVIRDNGNRVLMDYQQRLLAGITLVRAKEYSQSHYNYLLSLERPSSPSEGEISSIDVIPLSLIEIS